MVDNLKRNISFNESLHQYTDEYNKEYTSVTTLIGKYHPQFDLEYWAKRKAEELGTTPEIVKQSWKDITDFSCEKGSKEHKLLEDSINQSNGNAKFNIDNKIVGSGLGFNVINRTNLFVLSKSGLATKHPIIFEYLEKYIKDGWTLYAEKRTYWADYLVAGTIDCLLVKEKLFMIVDWKTNKDELKFRSGYYKKVSGVKTNQWIDKKEYFFKPLQNIEYCKGKIYTLQLSLYAYILELWGMQCISLVLFHIMDNKEPTLHNIVYEKVACQLLLVDFKNRSSINSSTKSITNTIIKLGIK